MFVKQFGAAICTMLVVVSSALAQSSGNSVCEKNQETNDSLNTLTVSVDFFETRMEDVLASLGAQAELVFVLDQSAADNNLDAETLISKRLSNTRLATVLKFILDEHQCTWTVKDGVVVVLSVDASLDYRNFGTIVFDCKDLISKIKPAKLKRTIRPSAPGGGNMGGGVFSVGDHQEQQEEGGGTGGGDAAVDPKPAPEKVAEAASATESQTTKLTGETLSGREQLLAVIVETIDAHSWVQNGGNGTIIPLNDVFVVRQTQSNLRDIHELLSQLRATKLDD